MASPGPLWTRTLAVLLFPHSAHCVFPRRWSERHVRGARRAGGVADHAGGEPAPLHVHHAPGPPGLHLPAANRLLHLLRGHSGRLAHGHVRRALPERPAQGERGRGRGGARAADGRQRAHLPKQGGLGPGRVPATDLVASDCHLITSFPGAPRLLTRLLTRPPTPSPPPRSKRLFSKTNKMFGGHFTAGPFLQACRALP